MKIKKIILPAVLTLILSGCKANNVPEETPSSADETTGWTEPVTVHDDSLSSRQKTTWHCVSFGSYPMTEITGSEYHTIAGYAVDETDVVYDEALYKQLEQAEWTDNETEINGTKYRRMTALDAVAWASGWPQRYDWEDENTWHYFRYDPVRWRIIEVNGDVLTLMADRLLDCSPYHTEAAYVNWQDSTMRSFLNGYDETANSAGISYARAQDSFYGTAFTDEEKAAVLKVPVENLANYYFGTDCGEDTEDYVYLLSEAEVFSSDAAERHGFYPGDGVDDPSRRFRPTPYAMARGSWYSPVEDYKGNGFWFMRTNGYTAANVTYICDFGYIYNRGTFVTCNDSGILPVIQVDSTKAVLVDAGTVSSSEIVERQEHLGE